MKTKYQRMVVLISALLVVLLAGYGIYQVRRSIEQKQSVSEDRTYLKPAEQPSVEKDGHVYRYNSNLKTIVLLGIDKTGALKETQFQQAGQSDVILLVTFDLKKKSYFVVPINRDTITDVTVYGPLGAELGVQQQQITLAYGYGNGSRISGENTLKSLGVLMDGIPFAGYIATPVDTVALVNDAVGGISVQVDVDFSRYDPTLKEGETITLTGEQAIHFVRGRKEVGDESNVGRMKRQQQFYNALMQKCQLMSEKQLLNLYQTIASYTKASMGQSEIANYLAMVATYTYEGMYQIKGVNVSGDPYMEFYPDTDALRDLLIAHYLNA